MSSRKNYKWRFGEILVQNGWITWEQLEKALEIQRQAEKSGKDLTDTLVKMGAISEKGDKLLNLGEILIKHSWLTWDQLSEGLRIQKDTDRMIGEILLGKGNVTERNLYQGLALQLGKTFVDIEKVDIPPESIRLVPKRIVQEYQMMPLVAKERIFLIALSNPNNLRAEDVVQSLTGDYQVRSVIACPSKIRQAIEKYYGEK